MRNFKISTVATIAVYAIFAVVFSSCEESKYPETPSKFVVKRIELNKTSGTSIYLVKPLEQKDLNISITWFVDSIGMFNAGDTLSFQHYN